MTAAAIDGNACGWLDVLARQPGAERRDGWVITDVPFSLCNSVVMPRWPDDEADARELLAAGLGQCGAEVTTVSSAREALDALVRLKFDALVSDIGMPGEDGISLIERVRRLEAAGGGRVHAVALTAYAGEDDRRRIIEAGYDLHVPKPVNTGTLIGLLVHLVADGASNGRSA